MANVQRSIRGENGINVGAQRDVPSAKPWMHPEYIPHVIDADIVQPNLPEAFREPGRPRRLSERRGRNSRHLHLPLEELRFLRAKPVER